MKFVKTHTAISYNTHISANATFILKFSSYTCSRRDWYWKRQRTGVKVVMPIASGVWWWTKKGRGQASAQGQCFDFPSALWHCWLGDRKSIWRYNCSTYSPSLSSCVSEGKSEGGPANPCSPGARFTRFILRYVIRSCYDKRCHKMILRHISSRFKKFLLADLKYFRIWLVTIVTMTFVCILFRLVLHSTVLFSYLVRYT